MHSGPNGNRPGGKLGASARKGHVRKQSVEIECERQS